MSSVVKKMKSLEKKIVFKTDEEIARYDTELKNSQMMSETIKEVKSYITKHTQPHEQLLFSFIPTGMARTSPFFPMSKRDMKYREYERMEWKTSWGNITIAGLKLSIYDETVLLSLLYLVKKNRAESFLTTRYELCKIANVTPARDTYAAIWGSIKRLSGTQITLDVLEGKGSKRKLSKAMTGVIISSAAMDEKTKKLEVVMNPYFLQMYADSFYSTSIDIKFRVKLKGDTSKALYRFYETQSSHKFNIYILKLANIINLNLPIIELRKTIRKGLKELRAKGYLERWMLPQKSEVVTIWKAKKKRLLYN